MDKIGTFFIYILPYLPQCFGFLMPYPCFQGTGGGLLFHSILFKVVIMLDNLDPPTPQKKKIQEGENAAFWPSCGFIIDFARKYWGGGWAVVALRL